MNLAQTNKSHVINLWFNCVFCLYSVLQYHWLLKINVTLFLLNNSFFSIILRARWPVKISSCFMLSWHHLLSNMVHCLQTSPVCLGRYDRQKIRQHTTGCNVFIKKRYFTVPYACDETGESICRRGHTWRWCVSQKMC